MKPAIAAFTVLLSIGGGFVAGIMGPELMGEKADDSPNIAKKETPIDVAEYDDSKLKEDIIRLGNADTALEQKLGVRISEVESENATLRDANKALKKEITTLKSAKPIAGTSVEATEVPTEGTPAFDDAVAKAIEKKAAADKIERDAQRAKQMEEWMASASKRTVEKLTEQLALDTVQQENVQRLLTEMNTKIAETATRGREARDNGEEFDWGTEMTAVSDATKESIKSELSSAQLATFNQLDEEGKINISGMGGRRGGGRR
ncbi:hypothetical protein OAU50_00570 [Planctomycetota bacterium]|nr:hypothetical protein [Planctomycetota bacterium]